MYSFDEAEHFEPFPDGGGYPLRFLKRAFERLEVTDPSKVVHLCSGSMKSGITVDIRPEVHPQILADCRKVPLPDASCDWIMADPPYAESYAENLYGTGKSYPEPGDIVKEMARLLKPGGRCALLHFVVPVTRRSWGLKDRKVYTITTGAGYAVRAWTMFTKMTPQEHAEVLAEIAAKKAADEQKKGD